MKKQKQSRMLRGLGRLDRGIPHPPPISAQIVHTQRLRFVITTTASSNAVITWASLLDAICVANTATAGTQLFDHIKLRAVEIWYSPAIGGSNQVAVEFSGTAAGFVGDGKVWSDNSMGVEPAHVRAVPQRLSQVAQWQPRSTNTAFLVTAPIGAVLDVEVSLRTVTSVAPAALQAALVGATAGEIYYRGIDGQAIAATTYVPQAAAVQ
jgi:hypothetical protein